MSSLSGRLQGYFSVTALTAASETLFRSVLEAATEAGAPVEIHMNGEGTVDHPHLLPADDLHFVGGEEDAVGGDLLKMVTQGGAAAMLEDGGGRIVPGAPADLIAVDMDQPHLWPTQNAVNTLVERSWSRLPVLDIKIIPQYRRKGNRVMPSGPNGASARSPCSRRRPTPPSPSRR